MYKLFGSHDGWVSGSMTNGSKAVTMHRSLQHYSLALNSGHSCTWTSMINSDGRPCHGHTPSYYLLCEVPSESSLGGEGA